MNKQQRDDLRKLADAAKNIAENEYDGIPRAYWESIVAIPTLLDYIEGLEFENERIRQLSADKDATIAGKNWKVDNLKSKREWISVKSRRPEKFVEVLVFDAMGGDISVSYVANTHITHWMPLPEIPKLE